MVKKTLPQIKARKLPQHFGKAHGGGLVKTIQGLDLRQAFRIDAALALINAAALRP